jgi:hypothetical protein
MSGITTHCDTVPFAGSKKDTKGKAGFCCFVSASVMIKALLRGPDTWSSFLFLRGRCDVGAMFTFSIPSRSSTVHAVNSETCRMRDRTLGDLDLRAVTRAGGVLPFFATFPVVHGFEAESRDKKSYN